MVLPVPWLKAAAALAAAMAVTACGEATLLPPRADEGVKPSLGQPVRSLIPTVNIAPARAWPAGTAPQPAAGWKLSSFSAGLDHPRWLLVLRNGDVLVAEANAPKRAKDSPGIKGWIMRLVMKRAGAGVPSANRITLLRDADGDGVAEQRELFAEGLNSPFGMALVGDRLYVANTDAVLEFAYTDGQTKLDAPLRRLTELPAGEINHHWTKSLIASPDGSKLFVGVGSNSNVAENGLAAEEGRAAVWEIDRASGSKRLYASGLRNPVGLAWLPTTQGVPRLWAVVNERDELGSDLVPDYLTAVDDGAFYGWPFTWWGTHADVRVTAPDPRRATPVRVPDFSLGSHVAPLGLAAGRLAGREGMFVGLHGSWNRRPHSGYKVVFVRFEGGAPQGLAQDVLTGFLDGDGKARGRPVGVAVDARGALLVADDVGNTVWRLEPGTASR